MSIFMDDSRKHHPTIHACTTFVITGKNFENMWAISLDVDFMSAALSIFMTGNSFTITLGNLISGPQIPKRLFNFTSPIFIKDKRSLLTECHLYIFFELIGIFGLFTHLSTVLFVEQAQKKTLWFIAVQYWPTMTHTFKYSWCFLRLQTAYSSILLQRNPCDHCPSHHCSVSIY